MANFLNSRLPQVIINDSSLVKKNPVDGKKYIRQDDAWVEFIPTTKVDIATETVPGIVMPDGTTTGINAEGKLNATKAVETAKTYADTKATELQTQIDSINSRTDVVDTVATKADLDAYNKTPLKNKNVIIVLKDESQSNAQSYYRYNGTTFDYIGSTAASYTKAEADTLLTNKVDKVEGKTLSTNDFTTEDKTSLTEVASRKKSSCKTIFSSNLTGKVTPDADSLIEPALSTTGGIIPNPFGNDTPVYCTLQGGTLVDTTVTWTTEFIGGASFVPAQGIQVVNLTTETDIDIVKIYVFTTDLK